jgi:hypothetical protein
LWAEQNEQLDWSRAGAAKPMRGVGIEFGDLSGFHDQVKLAEPQP